MSVQGLSAKSCQRFACVFRQQGGLGFEAGAIRVVAEQGMTDVGEMDADLVGPAGLEPTSEEGGDRFAVGSDVGFEEPPMRDRLSAAFAHSLFVPSLGVTLERSIDRASGPAWAPPNKGQIFALECAIPAMVGKLARQRLVGAVIL